MKANSIVIVNGNININTEYKRKSVLARDLRFITLTQVREQAISLGLFDGKKYNPFANISISENKVVENISQKPEIKEDSDVKDETIEERIEEDNVEIEDSNVENDCNRSNDEKVGNAVLHSLQEESNKFVIKIPPTAKKEDLLELKEFLGNQKSGEIQIFIEIKGQEIDTKFSIYKLDELKKWVEIKFNYSK